MGTLIEGPWSGGPERPGSSITLVDQLTHYQPAFAQAHEGLSRAVDIFSSMDIWPDQCHRAGSYVVQLEHLYGEIIGLVRSPELPEETMALKYPVIVTLFNGQASALRIISDTEEFSKICRNFSEQSIRRLRAITKELKTLQETDEKVLEELTDFIQRVESL